MLVGISLVWLPSAGLAAGGDTTQKEASTASRVDAKAER